MILALEVRLIDRTGTQVGTVDTGDALRRDREAGLDLVEVSPDVRPPVRQILDDGRFRRALEKADRERKRKPGGDGFDRPPED